MKALETLPGITAGGVFSSPILPGKHHLVPGFLKYAKYMNRLAGKSDESTQILAYLPGQLAAIDQLRDALINAARVDFHWYDDAKHVITVNSAHHALEEDVIAFMQQENEG